MHNFGEPSITTQRLFPQQMSMKKHYWIIGSCHKYEACKASTAASAASEKANDKGKGLNTLVCTGA
jgi:hypothetical protein